MKRLKHVFPKIEGGNCQHLSIQQKNKLCNCYPLGDHDYNSLTCISVTVISNSLIARPINSMPITDIRWSSVPLRRLLARDGSSQH